MFGICINIHIYTYVCLELEKKTLDPWYFHFCLIKHWFWKAIFPLFIKFLFKGNSQYHSPPFFTEWTFVVGLSWACLLVSNLWVLVALGAARNETKNFNRSSAGIIDPTSVLLSRHWTGDESQYDPFLLFHLMRKWKVVTMSAESN